MRWIGPSEERNSLPTRARSQDSAACRGGAESANDRTRTQKSELRARGPAVSADGSSQAGVFSNAQSDTNSRIGSSADLLSRRRQAALHRIRGRVAGLGRRNDLSFDERKGWNS